MSNTKLVFAWIGGFVLLLAIIFCFNAYDLATFTFFAPKYENVRRKTFENTQSYVHGKIQDLSSYKEQYELAKDSSDKKAIASVIKTQFASFDESKLPQGLQGFLYQIRGY